MSTNLDQTQVQDILSSFEQRMDRRFESMTESVQRLAGSVQLLADRDIRMQERESQQQAFNARIGSQLDKLVQDVNSIQLSRAEERQSLEAVKRAYPWLIILSILGPIVLTGVLTVWIKSSFEPPRQVLPVTIPATPATAPQ